MQKPVRTLKVALKNTRKERGLSLHKLGAKVDSDASHIFKIEQGQDITLSTLLRLAEALDVQVSFGEYVLTPEPEFIARSRKKTQ